LANNFHSPSIFFISSKIKSNKKLLFFTFYITSIIFYYYSNKKIHYKIKLFSLFYKTVPNIFIFYITSITFYYYSNKYSTITTICQTSSALPLKPWMYVFLSSKDQLSNIFTKPLVSQWFSLLNFNLNVMSSLRQILA